MTKSFFRNAPKSEIVTEIENIDFEEFHIALINIILDVSASMTSKMKDVYPALLSIIKGLKEENDKSIDIKFLVKITTFNNSVKELNTEYLLPGEIEDVLTEDDANCSGGTNLKNVADYIYDNFKTSSASMLKLRKYDAKITNIIITDCEGTDNAPEREAAINRLKNNRLLAKYGNTFVLFVGKQEYMSTAAAFTGGNEDNVIYIEDNIISCLAPIVIGSTIALSDGTRIDNDGTKTTGEIVEGTKLGEKEGEESGKYLSPEDLQKELETIFNN